MSIIAKLICRLSEIPIKILALFLSVVIHKLILKFIWKCKVPRIVKLKLYNILSNFLINALQKNSMQTLSDFLSVNSGLIDYQLCYISICFLIYKIKNKKTGLQHHGWQNQSEGENEWGSEGEGECVGLEEGLEEGHSDHVKKSLERVIQHSWPWSCC